MQGSDKMERRTPYLLQHACCVMIANAALGNLWVLPDFFQFILGFAGAQDWADAANHYLGDRMLLFLFVSGETFEAECEGVRAVFL